MWKLELGPRNSFSRNIQTGFSMQCVDPILDCPTLTHLQTPPPQHPSPPPPPVQLQSADAQTLFDIVTLASQSLMTSLFLALRLLSYVTNY
jgi:hypothetical protein